MMEIDEYRGFQLRLIPPGYIKAFDLLSGCKPLFFRDREDARRGIDILLAKQAQESPTGDAPAGED